MPFFSTSSQAKLNSCHPDLIHLFNHIITIRDCTILVGFRDREAQNEAFETGHSKEKWPNSKHNKIPSEAIDAAPWPIDWKNPERDYYWSGWVMGVAREMGILLRSGSDWDGDGNPRNQSLHDLYHFEIRQKDGRVYD